MSVLQVELVAADRKVWSGEATAVSARSTEGTLGILPGHAPILGVLVPGEVKITTTGGVQTVTVDGGFLSVDQNAVTVVADHVEGENLSQGSSV